MHPSQSGPLRAETDGQRHGEDDEDADGVPPDEERAGRGHTEDEGAQPHRQHRRRDPAFLAVAVTQLLSAVFISLLVPAVGAGAGTAAAVRP